MPIARCAESLLHLFIIKVRIEENFGHPLPGKVVYKVAKNARRDFRLLLF